MFGAISTLNNWLPAWSLVPGFVMLALMFVLWFGTVIGENENGMYNMAVDRSFRMGMMWFIFSEVMFFRCVLRRAVLRARTGGPLARGRRHEGL